MKSGICRYCGCTQGRACVFQLAAGRFRGAAQLTVCWWIDPARTVCSAPKCMQKYLAFIARLRVNDALQ